MKEYSNFLAEELADKLYNIGDNVIRGKYTEKINIWTNYKWDKTIIEDSSVVICFSVPEIFLQDIQNSLIEKNIFDPSTDVSLIESKSASVYVWTKNSYIPAHTDGTYSKAVTVYLNRKWKYNDGGLFNWQDKNDKNWKIITPTFNKAVVNDLGYLHGTTPVKSDNFRITLQIFLNNKVNNE